MSSDRDVRDMLLFTHKIRHELLSHDNTKAATMQWQSNRCHYLHKFLHGNIICNLSTSDPMHWTRVATHYKARKKASSVSKISGQEEIERKLDAAYRTPGRRKTWSKELVTSFSRLISACRFHQGGQEPVGSKGRGLLINERLMEYTSEWCNACNIEATNHVKNKGMLFGARATEEDRGIFNPLLNVPMFRDLPMGTKLMHDTYLFIYLLASFLAVFVQKLTTLPHNSQIQVRSARFISLPGQLQLDW